VLFGQVSLTQNHALSVIGSRPYVFLSSLFANTILTTNTSWGGTVRMAEGLVSQFGQPLLEDPTRRAFPTPEQLAALNERSLRS
jgi:3-methyladenine DNA glycosylase/8-oxoguanine DNA glycosylase